MEWKNSFSTITPPTSLRDHFPCVWQILLRILSLKCRISPFKGVLHHVSPTFVFKIFSLDQGPFLWRHWLLLFWTLCVLPHGFQIQSEYIACTLSCLCAVILKVTTGVTPVFSTNRGVHCISVYMAWLARLLSHALGFEPSTQWWAAKQCVTKTDTLPTELFCRPVSPTWHRDWVVFCWNLPPLPIYYQSALTPATGPVLNCLPNHMTLQSHPTDRDIEISQ